MVDAHTHLDQYGDDLPKALDQIRNLSIRTLTVSMDIPSFRETQRIAESEPLIIPSFRETQRIAESEPLIIPSFGIHPWKAPEYADRLDELAEPLEEALAIGEIGLDYRFVEDKSMYPAQRTVFNYFLDAAERSGKLINLHTSGAEREIIENLQDRKLPAIIVHWYSGPMKFVEKYLELGTYFTIGVEVLQSEKIQTLARELPKDRILTETDNPGGWKWLKGKNGFPDLIEPVETKIAEIRGLSREAFSEIVTSNFNNVLKAGDILC